MIANKQEQENQNTNQKIFVFSLKYFLPVRVTQLKLCNSFCFSKNQFTIFMGKSIHQSTTKLV